MPQGAAQPKAPLPPARPQETCRRRLLNWRRSGTASSSLQLATCHHGITTYLSFIICALSSVQDNEAGKCKRPEIQARQACDPGCLHGVPSLEMGERVTVQYRFPPAGAIGLE